MCPTHLKIILMTVPKHRDKEINVIHRIFSGLDYSKEWERSFASYPVSEPILNLRETSTLLYFLPQIIVPIEGQPMYGSNEHILKCVWRS